MLGPLAGVSGFAGCPGEVVVVPVPEEDIVRSAPICGTEPPGPLSAGVDPGLRSMPGWLAAGPPPAGAPVAPPFSSVPPWVDPPAPPLAPAGRSNPINALALALCRRITAIIAEFEPSANPPGAPVGLTRTLCASAD